MTSFHRPWFWAVAVAIPLTIACSSERRGPPPKPEPKPVKHPMPKLDPAKPGYAYFATKALGLAVLTPSGKFVHIPSKHRWFRQLAPAPDGSVVACSLHDCLHLKGDQVIKRWANRSFMDKGAAAGPSKFDHVAVGKNNDLWVLDSTELCHFSGGAWTRHKTAEALGSDVGSIQGIAADGKGGVWIATHKYLFKRDGTKWTKIDVKEKNVIWEDVVPNTHGVVKALSFSRKIYGLGGAKPAEAKVASFEMARHMAVGKKGQLYLASSRKLLITPAEGGLPTVYAMKKLKQYSGDIRAIATDDNGRVWLAADRGIHIMKPDGTFYTWKTGTIPALNSPVDAILVLGGGPPLPKVGAVKTGGISATIVRSGKPVAGATVELCTRPSSLLRGGQTPCSSAHWSQKTKTDPNGRFVFSKVPLGVYGFAVKPTGDPKWTVSFTDFGAGMQENQVMHVGQLRLRARR